MKAWLLDDFKGLDCLRLEEVETPRPGEGEVLVKVGFAALNPADRFLAERLYPANPALPHILGRDGSGVVEAVGAGVKQVRPGEHVCILRGDAGVRKPGTFAQYVVVPEVAVAPVPQGWKDEEAGAGPLVYLTSWQALTQWGPLNQLPPTSEIVARPEGPIHVLITGLSGGVGLASLHLAKAFGYRVIGTTRGTSKQAKLREHGADLLVDPGDPDLRKKVKEFTGGKGVDLVIDNIAGELFNVVLDTLGYGGRISVVGMLGGIVPNFQTAKLLFKRTRIGGVLVNDYQGEQAQRTWKEIVGHLNAIGRRPVVDSIFAFEQLREAFERLAGGPFGKVLLRTEAA